MNKYNRIRDLREDNDKTQKEIADMLYMHLTQYRRYETGESEIPFNIAINIANLYDISLDYLAERTAEKGGLQSIRIDQEEKKLLELFKQLPQNEKNLILELLRSLNRKFK